MAGLLAGLSATLGFDYFLTRPYLHLRIDSMQDIELAVLLLLVSLAVSELASWGIRQSAAANEQSGFIKGVLESADLASGSTNQVDALERVSATIGRTLGADLVSFVYADHDAGAAVIGRDGSVRRRGIGVDVTAKSLPSGPDAYTAIPIAQRGAQIGYFRISTTRVIRPTRQQLCVAALLASQWSLRAHRCHWDDRGTTPTAHPSDVRRGGHVAAFRGGQNRCGLVDHVRPGRPWLRESVRFS